MTISNWLRKLLRIEREETTVPKTCVVNVQVECPACGWTGTVVQSMRRNTENDSCPECGNLALIHCL